MLDFFWVEIRLNSGLLVYSLSTMPGCILDFHWAEDKNPGGLPGADIFQPAKPMRQPLTHTKYFGLKRNIESYNLV
jgi:hypothetical protein